MIEITLANVEKTLWEIAKYNVKLTKEFDDVVKKYSKKVVSKAKADAPRGPTKNLKNSIRAKYFTKAGPASTVFPRGKKGAHRHLVEYGTKYRTQKTTGRRTGEATPKPFMGPAVAAYESQYLAEIKRLVEKDVTV